MTETAGTRSEEKAPDSSSTNQDAVNLNSEDTMTGSELQVVSVPFHEDQIEAIKGADGTVYALPKRICENIGVNWKTQFRKLQRDPIWGMVIMTIPSQGGFQETCVIPVTKVALWVSGIQANKVSPEVQEKMKVYREECAIVLDRHFRLNQEVSSPSGNAAEIGSEVAKALLPIIVSLQNSDTRNAEDIARLNERVAKLESGEADRPVKEGYMTVYGYCRSRGIKTNKEINRQHTNRLKKIVAREGLDVVPKLIKIHDYEWSLYHWPVWFLDRYFSHEQNRTLGQPRRDVVPFSKPVDVDKATK